MLKINPHSTIIEVTFIPNDVNLRTVMRWEKCISHYADVLYTADGTQVQAAGRCLCTA